MKKTVFNFKYNTNDIEVTPEIPMLSIDESLISAIDSKIACFTNVVPLTESTYAPQKFTVHTLSSDGKKGKFSHTGYSWKSVARNSADAASHIHGKAATKYTHITNEKGETVWKNGEDASSRNESVEFDNTELSELSANLLDRHSKERFRQADGEQYNDVKKDALIDAGNKSAGRGHFSPDKVTKKIDSDLVKDKEFQAQKEWGDEVVSYPKDIKSKKHQLPDSSNKAVEAAAPAKHGPGLNQEIIKKLNLGKTMEAVTFTYAELSDIFSAEITESSVHQLWKIDIIKENNIHKYLIMDGDDVLAEGSNFSAQATAKSAYKKCVQLETYILDKVLQPSRVLSISKQLINK